MFMAICNAGTNGVGTILWLYRSTDGLTWTPYNAYLLKPSVGGWDNGKIYRASAVKTESGFDLWYSAENTSGVWKTGRTTVIL